MRSHLHSVVPNLFPDYSDILPRELGHPHETEKAFDAGRAAEGILLAAGI